MSAYWRHPGLEGKCSDEENRREEGAGPPPPRVVEIILGVRAAEETRHHNDDAAEGGHELSGMAFDPPAGLQRQDVAVGIVVHRGVRRTTERFDAERGHWLQAPSY